MQENVIVFWLEAVMERLREEFDLDWQASAICPTSYKTAQNKYRLHCDLCKRHFYVDEIVYNQAKYALESDPSNNSFVCDECLDEMEVFSFERG